jgi:hypothetical protein
MTGSQDIQNGWILSEQPSYLVSYRIVIVFDKYLMSTAASAMAYLWMVG